MVVIGQRLVALVAVAALVGCGQATPRPATPARFTTSTTPPTTTTSSTSTSTTTPTSSTTQAAPSIAATTSQPAAKEAVEEPRPQLKRYDVVLSVGDSFNGALSLALEKRFEAEGSRFVRDVWVGVAIATFDRERRFQDLLTRSAPDLVVVSLGANDVNDGDAEAAAAHVRSIVAKIGARDCVWIAPALWKNDTGIVDVIERNVAPCRFFPSQGFVVERGRDGWHPSVRGGQQWADAFWAFFRGDQRQPTAIEPPHGTSTR